MWKMRRWESYHFGGGFSSLFRGQEDEALERLMKTDNELQIEPALRVH